MQRPKQTWLTVGLAAGLGGFLALRLGLGLPGWWAWWGSFSAAVFAAYGIDKWQARRPGSPRIPEIVLHLLAAVGGVAGAWIGRSVFRHKTRHPAFAVVLVISTGLHLALWYFFARGR